MLLRAPIKPPGRRRVWRALMSALPRAAVRSTSVSLISTARSGMSKTRSSADRRDAVTRPMGLLYHHGVATSAAESSGNDISFRGFGTASRRLGMAELGKPLLQLP